MNIFLKQLGHTQTFYVLVDELNKNFQICAQGLQACNASIAQNH